MGRAWSAPPRGGRRGGRVLALGIGFFLLVTAGVGVAMPPIVPRVAPDLLLESPSVSPVLPHAGDIVHVSVRVVNVGGLAASTASVELLDSRPNGDLISIGLSSLTSPLGPGQSTVLEPPTFFAVGAGEHTLVLRLVDVTPAESNASNGVLSLWMKVLPATAPQQPPPSSSDGLRAQALEVLGLGALIGFLFVIAAIGVAVAYVGRRRGELPLEPPPPEPRDESPPPLWPP